MGAASQVQGQGHILPKTGIPHSLPLGSFCCCKVQGPGWKDKSSQVILGLA